MTHTNAIAGPSTFTTPLPPHTTAHLAHLAPVSGVGADDAGSLAPGPHIFTDAQIEEWKEQDRYLPIANVGRIMKNILPDNAKIAKEAKECVQECVSEFISFLSSEAADKVLTDKRKTINGEDVIYSMNQLGFDNYSEACKVYLTKYRHRLNENQSRISSRLNSPDQAEISPSSSILDHEAFEAEDDDILSLSDEDDSGRPPTTSKKSVGAGVDSKARRQSQGTATNGQAKQGTGAAKPPAGKKRKSTGGAGPEVEAGEAKKRKNATGPKAKGG